MIRDKNSYMLIIITVSLHAFKQEYKFINVFWQERQLLFLLTTFPATLKTHFTAIKNATL